MRAAVVGALAASASCDVLGVTVSQLWFLGGLTFGLVALAGFVVLELR